MVEQGTPAQPSKKLPGKLRSARDIGKNEITLTALNETLSMRTNRAESYVLNVSASGVEPENASQVMKLGESDTEKNLFVLRLCIALQGKCKETGLLFTIHTVPHFRAVQVGDAQKTDDAVKKLYHS